MSSLDPILLSMAREQGLDPGQPAEQTALLAFARKVLGMRVAPAKVSHLLDWEACEERSNTPSESLQAWADQATAVLRELSSGVDETDLERWIRFGREWDQNSSLERWFPLTHGERENLRAALTNVRLLAARHRQEDWAQHMLRFCSDAGVVPRPLRAQTD